ncbi:hypothetical protein M8818_000371 [Zalaria obscura]|uniref:Uncharacterized protein n=1 Tax=Zalaria obscura TaxID=2024903 RepID=A0ACC3SN65_9PEZI
MSSEHPAAPYRAHNAGRHQRAQMAPPLNGNAYTSFAEMIKLEKINEVTYRSTAPPFSPFATGRAYGGHVYAQAVWAASQTVGEGFVVHVCVCPA